MVTSGTTVDEERRYCEWISLAFHPNVTCPLTSMQGGATPTFLALTPKAKLTGGEFYFLCAPSEKAQPVGWDWDQDPARLFDVSAQWIRSNATAK